MSARLDLLLETLEIPAAALSAEESFEALRLVAEARERLLAVEIQAAALRLARLFHESPEIGWFRFYKNEAESYGRDPVARLVCDLWDAEELSFPDSLLNPEPDGADDDGEAERERLMLASRYQELEAWTESLSSEAFARLASASFERPERDGEAALAERFLRQSLTEAQYARWERARLQRFAGEGEGESSRARSL